MTGKQIKPLTCKNRICSKFLCLTDGELFYVENLEILPKTRGTKKRLTKIIICPRCGWENKIYLKKAIGGAAEREEEEMESENKSAKGKFLIFRSRF